MYRSFLLVSLLSIA